MSTSPKREGEERLRMKKVRPDSTVDAVGLYCPMPVILTTERMEELRPGQVLELLADDPEVLEDIPRWCKMSGNRFLRVERNESVYKLYLKKGVKKE
jgi:TusA-related sulfurtransferase